MPFLLKIARCWRFCCWVHSRCFPAWIRPNAQLLKDLGGGIEPMSFKTVVATLRSSGRGQFSQACWMIMFLCQRLYDAGIITPRSWWTYRRTNGVILYQEQTMNATRLLAGSQWLKLTAFVKRSAKKTWRNEEHGWEVHRSGSSWLDRRWLEDGTTQRIHRAEHFKCEDGHWKLSKRRLNTAQNYL